MIDQVGDFRLARGIFEDGFAFRKRCGHQNILGARDGNFFEYDVRALQLPVSRRFRLDVTIGHRDVRAHLFERGKVQVHGPRTDRASAGQ